MSIEISRSPNKILSNSDIDLANENNRFNIQSVIEHQDESKIYHNSVVSSSQTLMIRVCKRNHTIRSQVNHLNGGFESGSFLTVSFDSSFYTGQEKFLAGITLDKKRDLYKKINKNPPNSCIK